MDRKQLLMCIYFLLFVASVLFPDMQKYIVLLIILLNISMLLVAPKFRGVVLLSSFLMPGEIFPIINTICSLIIGRKSLKVYKIKRSAIYPIFLIVLPSLFNSLLNGTVINMLFYLMYLLVLVVVACFSEDMIEIKDTLYSIKLFVLIEFVATLIIIAQRRSIIPGDAFSGTFESAHWLGNWIIVNLAVLFYVHIVIYKDSIYKTVKNNLLTVCTSVFILYLADAKSLLLALFVGLLLYYVLNITVGYKHGIAAMILGSYAFFFIISYILNNSTMQSWIYSLNETLGQYIYEVGWNGKIHYLIGTFSEELKGFHFFFGYGLGQYGSRVANMFAYSEMWRNNNAINNFISSNFTPHYIEQYARYIRYYTSDFVGQISWRSAVMSYPFNSFTALIGEIGVVGVVTVSLFVDKITQKSACRFLVYYFVVACVFDIYVDNFPCIAIVIVMLLNSNTVKIK